MSGVPPAACGRAGSSPRSRRAQGAGGKNGKRGARRARCSPLLRTASAFVSAFLLAALAGGCATPAERIAERAAELGFSRSVLPGGPFHHLAYQHHADGDTLHVYIEHDGSPWLAGRIAADPTPRKPLMLELMALDRAPALYLGRPCHFATGPTPPCSALWWTHRRYAEEVVDSMAHALRAVLAERPFRRIAFFGHSGGGTLAVLLAERFPETCAVVTLAGNLQVARWAELHGYTPLEGSLDPATRPALPAGIVQRHYVGSADTNVSSALVRGYSTGRPGAEWIEVAGADHACCWRERWPGILATLERELTAGR